MLRDRGVDIPESRLRSWREDGLMPAALRGGTARYAANAVDQAGEAHRLFKIKNSAKYVGWHLWWRGYEVDGKYWRPVIEGAGKTWLKAATPLGALVGQLHNDSSEKADHLDDDLTRVLQRIDLGAPYSVSTRRMNLPTKEVAMRVMLDAATGHYEPHHEKIEEDNRISSLRAITGMNSASDHTMLGHQINVRDGLKEFLRACVGLPELSVSNLTRGNRIAVLLGARDDLRNIFDIATDLYDATAWVYGPRPFGLGVLNKIIAAGKPQVMATLLVLWTAIRETENAFLSSEEIRQMRVEAKRALCLSRQFKTLVEGSPALQTLATPKAMKKAFRTQDDLNDFCNKLRGKAIK